MAVIAILAALTFGTVLHVRSSADKGTAASQMRQVGTGLVQFTTENDGYLPGPLKVGQGAMYDPGVSDQLATHLGPYLGIEDRDVPALVEVFLPPAYESAMRNLEVEESRPYLLNVSLDTDSGRIHPWGNDKGQNPKGPMPLGMVPTTLWAMVDADQLNPGVKGHPWASKTPERVIHGSRRLALYFDGSVRDIQEGELETAGPPPPPPGGGPGKPPPPPGGGSGKPPPPPPK